MILERNLLENERDSLNYRRGNSESEISFFNLHPMKAILGLSSDSHGDEVAYAQFTRLFEGWGEWMDMGTSGGELYQDLMGMLDRGYWHLGVDSRSGFSL